MILMRPSALLWGLAAAVIVLVYLRAIRPARVEVATGRLWLRILGEPRTSARLRAAAASARRRFTPFWA